MITTCVRWEMWTKTLLLLVSQQGNKSVEYNLYNFEHHNKYFHKLLNLQHENS
jgi:hypothetical protein